MRITPTPPTQVLPCPFTKKQANFGNKYLVFTNFPNGYPLQEMTETEAEDVLHRTNPGVPVTRDQYVYGRTRWNAREVGVVVYPLQEDDSQTIDSILNDPQLQTFSKDDKVNDLMPGIIEHDQGKIFVYDRSLSQLIRDPEAIINRHQFHALSDDSTDDEPADDLSAVVDDLATSNALPTEAAATLQPASFASPLNAFTLPVQGASPYWAAVQPRPVVSKPIPHSLFQYEASHRAAPAFAVLKAASFGTSA